MLGAYGIVVAFVLVFGYCWIVLDSPLAEWTFAFDSNVIFGCSISFLRIKMYV